MQRCFILAAFLIDACEEVADIAHLGILGIVRVLGTRGLNREFDLERMDSRNRVSSRLIRKGRKAYQLLNDRFWRKADAR
jgi:hypothetical protein